MLDKKLIKKGFSVITAILLLIVFLYPFNQFYWHYGWEVNIPYADLLIIILGVLSLVLVVRDLFKNNKQAPPKQWLFNLMPLLFLFIAGALSLLNVWPEQLLISIKYWWRFVAFYYIFYFLLVQLLAKKEKTFWQVSWCLYGLGIFLSIMGLFSILWPETYHSFRMATPLSWLGLFPYGSSHNLLAEALVSIILFSWLVVYRYQKKFYAKWLYLGLAFMVAITCLTFSRTGWLVLWLELSILLFVYYDKNITNWLKKYWWIGLLLVVIIAVYFITFGQTNFVTSSNEARSAMIVKSLQLWQSHPWFGNGVGTWQEIVSKDVYYTYQFGQPLEQHGVLWKLLSEQGIVGVFTWFGMMFYFLYVLLKNYLGFNKNNPWQWPALIAFLVVLGQFVFQLLDTGYYSAKMWLPLGLAFALMYISRQHINIIEKE